jgi:hypothetical protein
MRATKRPASRMSDATESRVKALIMVYGRPKPAAKTERRLEQEARALELGIVLPTWPDAADHAAMKAQVEKELLAPSATVDDYINSMLPPAAAAKTFRDWWLASNAKRQLTSEELHTLYEGFCKATKRIPTPSNQLRKHLRKLGVVRNKSDGRAHGKRYRPTIWTLSDRQMRLAA